MARKTTYGNIEYNCDTLTTYNTVYVNKKPNSEILKSWVHVFSDFFNCIDLEDEFIITLGRLIEDECRYNQLSIATTNKMEELNILMNGTVPGERMNCYYKIFEPLKYRQMKIDKILNGKNL